MFCKKKLFDNLHPISPTTTLQALKIKGEGEPHKLNFKNSHVTFFMQQQSVLFVEHRLILWEEKCAIHISIHSLFYLIRFIKL